MIRDALERVLAEHFGRPVALAEAPTAISGGFWASISGFRLAEGSIADAPTHAAGHARSDADARWAGRLVLRVMPDRTRAAHEIVVQRVVAECGFTTPPVLLDGYDEGLGGAFMIMPYAPGRSPLSGLEIGSFVGLPSLMRRLPVQLADVATALHAVDPQPIQRALAAAGMSATGDGGQSRLDAIRAASLTAALGFDRLLAWFERYRPRPAALVVCHGDLHPFNLLIDDDGGTTVLDWTNADLLPREFDVGFTAGILRCAPFAVPRPFEWVFGRLTRWMAERFVESYERSAPLDAGMLQWFEALQHARCLAEVATARSGLTTIVGPKHPFETSSSAMIRRLGELTGITVTLPVRAAAPIPADG